MSAIKRSIIGLLPLTLLLVCLLSAATFPPGDIDHAAVIGSLNKTTLEKGRQIYIKSCIACHGADGTASNPQARSFARDKLRFGNRPYEMWITVTRGAGMMAPQTWLSPQERYYVIQYIREMFIKKSNPTEYFPITEKYLARLPKSLRSAGEQQALAKREALKGSQKYGQEWFQHINSDYGHAIYSQLKDHATSVLTVSLGHQVKLSYNLLRMGVTAAWQGALNLDETKYRKYRGEGQPVVQGKTLAGLDTWQWTYHDQLDSLEKSTGVRTPLPAAFLEYRGNYVYGKQVILSYNILGRPVLELPQALATGGNILLSQTLTIAPGNAADKLYIGYLKDAVKKDIHGVTVLSDRKTGAFIAVKIIATDKDIRCEMDAQQRMVMTIPASAQPIRVQVLRMSGRGSKALQSFLTYALNPQLPAEMPVPEELIHGGPAQWTKTVTTQGERDANKVHFDPIFREDRDRTDPKKSVPMPPDYPYTIDNIGLPFNNPYQAWIRPTCLGFKRDGSLLIATYTGDVWMGRGIDSALHRVVWSRIATGLFECMGIKVVRDDIYVTTRNGIVLLRDLNGDGETDFYENFYSDRDVSSFFHAFNFGLETDSKGNFYYTKVGEYTDNKDPGDVIRVSADGKNWESIATGFRVNNGITISPDDRIFVSDNQGNWEPANKICLIKKNAFYGYVPNLVSENEWSPDGRKFGKDQLIEDVIRQDIVPVPDSFEQPAFWIPQEFDNSPGGGVWSDAAWGPLGNQFIHTSYGTGWIYYFLPHETENITQGAMIAMPFQLPAGIQRAAVNPVDKQVYVTGLTGWDDPEAVRYGVLSRIRYKGGRGHLLRDAEVVRNGIRLDFNFSLNDTASGNTSRYDVSAWNYQWTSHYGSAHYSIREPGKTGEDKLPVTKVTLLNNNQSIILHIPGLGPAQTVRLRFDVNAADHTDVNNSVYLTILKMPR